ARSYLARIGQVPLVPADTYLVSIFLTPSDEATNRSLISQPVVVQTGAASNSPGANTSPAIASQVSPRSLLGGPSPQYSTDDDFTTTFPSMSFYGRWGC